MKPIVDTRVPEPDRDARWRTCVLCERSAAMPPGQDVCGSCQDQVPFVPTTRSESAGRWSR